LSYVDYRDDNTFVLGWEDEEYLFTYHPKEKKWTHNVPNLTLKIKNRVKEHQETYERGFTEMEAFIRSPFSEMEIRDVEKRSSLCHRIIIGLKEKMYPRLVLFVNENRKTERVILDEEHRLWEFRKDYIEKDFPEIEEVRNWLYTKSPERLRFIYTN